MINIKRLIIPSLAALSLLLAQETKYAAAENQFLGLINDITIVEKESAEAKQVRLNWISEERDRIRDELRGYEKELQELRAAVPDPVRPGAMSPIAARAREVELRNFNSWCQSNDPDLRFAVIRGQGINALLRVLGPIAHYRIDRAGNMPVDKLFPSLSAEDFITSKEAMHFRLSPATSAGSRFVIRLNQTPLELEWPPIVIQKFTYDCECIGKAKNTYVSNLKSNPNELARLDSADLLDKALELLQAKIAKEKKAMMVDKRLDAKQRVKAFCELQDAIRYLETVRASVDRFKKAPGDFIERRFNGGTIENFLDFCYTHGLFFSTALPADEEQYMQIHVRMKAYARDIQYVENWKEEIESRMKELNDEDKKLLWAGAQQ